MARDPLRSTLDKLQVDPGASSERPYLEAALRRMGYTEAEIKERLGVEPAKPTEYRIVKPVIETGASRLQSPFEDIAVSFEEPEPVEFDQVEAENAEFQEIQDYSLPATEAPLAEEELLEFDVAFEEVPQAPDETAGMEQKPVKGRRKGDLQWDEEQLPPPGEEVADSLDFSPSSAANLESAARSAPQDYTIDTFGSSQSGAGAGDPRTRVRVRRVRASSRQEAEAKVAGKGRRVIKSIPVDIVERWGPGESREKGSR